MMLFLTFLLCVGLARWYLREPLEAESRGCDVNINPAVDEWNAREMVEEESESFYE